MRTSAQEGRDERADDEVSEEEREIPLDYKRKRRVVIEVREWNVRRKVIGDSLTVEFVSALQEERRRRHNNTRAQRRPTVKFARQHEPMVARMETDEQEDPRADRKMKIARA